MTSSARESLVSADGILVLQYNYVRILILLLFMAVLPFLMVVNPQGQ